MPDSAYRVARRVARELAHDLLLTPPFDVDAVAQRHAVLVDDVLPGRTDTVTLHGPAPGDLPRIVVQRSLGATPDRRRFAVAHALGHILLGWHPLGTPCDVSSRPRELPVSGHDLIEGEANAFARELLLPRAWLEGFDALERPAELIRHAAARAGVPVMPAARAVSLMLEPNHVWVVIDEWNSVLDAGRSLGTHICPPATGQPFDGRDYARLAAERHRADLEGCSLLVWRFDARDVDALPHDHTARHVAEEIALDVGIDADDLAARIDGAAGWANEQLGSASLAGMTAALDARVRALPEMSIVAQHGRFAALVDAKAVELVAKRLAR
ncbi:MAG: hypothetical protein JWN41_1066 [Thermoleophilia bacterium]|nr:hypothetical protein [Thermoleophilia bacterium]